MSPIQEDIAKSLEAFARGRGVTVLFDESKMGGAMLVLGDALDLTAAFIADYNRRNPATASAATPGAGARPNPAVLSCRAHRPHRPSLRPVRR